MDACKPRVSTLDLRLFPPRSLVLVVKNTLTGNLDCSCCRPHGWSVMQSRPALLNRNYEKFRPMNALVDRDMARLAKLACASWGFACTWLSCMHMHVHPNLISILLTNRCVSACPCWACHFPRANRCAHSCSLLSGTTCGGRCNLQALLRQLLSSKPAVPQQAAAMLRLESSSALRSVTQLSVRGICTGNCTGH